MKALLLLMLFLNGSVTHTGPICALPSEIAGYLDGEFDEHVIEYGVAANGSLVQVFASEGGETWTIVISTIGSSCILASGEGWRQVKPGEKL